MKNCLVKDLKGGMDKVLPIFGYATIAELEGNNVEVLQPEQVSFYNDAGVIKLSGDGYIIKDSINSGKEVYWVNYVSTGYGIHINSGKVFVQCTYNDLRVAMSLRGSFDTSCIVKNVDLSSAMLACNADDKTINTIEFVSLNMDGNIEKISGFPFRYLEIRSVNPSSIVGNIDNITRLNNGSTISKIRLENHPLIEGSLETFFDNVCSTAADGSFNLSITNCPNITYNGIGITGSLNKTITISNGSWSAN